MRKSFAAVFALLIFAVSVTAQPAKKMPAAIETAIRDAGRAEAASAFEQFDASRLAIDPNDLTREKIERLKLDFLPAVKPLLVRQGDYPQRLARVSAPIFLLHGAKKTETMVFKHRIPMVFTWRETFVTFSTGALDALTDEEVAALVAHEIGHLFFAEALGAARDRRDDRAARIIELKCDLAALDTLSKLNIESSSLIRALEKLVEKRERSAGAAGGRGSAVESSQAGSPSLESRRRVYALYLEAQQKKVEKTASVRRN